MNKYSLGLDIGTNSVGWAVVDENNQLVKKNGFTFWGVRMFEESNDASSRRSFRANRRRLARRKQRIRLLRDIFQDEINKVDPYFFERLDTSFYHLEDKKHNNIHNLFVDEYTDKEFFDEFPTIYHLRNHLMTTEKKGDIRFLYLALHNILKYRGNFLHSGEIFNTSDFSSIKVFFNELNSISVDLQNEFEDFDSYFEPLIVTEDFLEEFNKIMLEKSSKFEKKNNLKTLFNAGSKTLLNECIIPLLISGKCNFANLNIVKDNKYEKCEIVVNSDSLESDIDDCCTKIPELSILLEFVKNVKSVIDFYFIIQLLGDSKSISQSMKQKYEEHNDDLNRFKNFIKQYLPEKYDECFRTYKKELNNYVSYIGMNSTSKLGKVERFSHCSKDEFYKYINSLLNQVSSEDALEEIHYYRTKIDNGDFLAKQRSNQNGSLPMQLHLYELKCILDNQKVHWDFLNIVDGSGISNYEKIISIFKFVIPYYIGPLNTKSDKSWVVRANDKIYPWNFDKVVDIDTTATEFIHRMQNKCTYLKGDDDYCLPKNSIIFSTYNCFSYLNKISINGSLIDCNVKNKLFEDVFLKIKKPTRKDIVTYLHSNFGNVVIKTSLLKDLPEINCNMASYIKFKEILGDIVDNKLDFVEKIIKDIVIFEDKKILENRLRKVYGLSNSEIKQIKDLYYKGYSSLSNRLLNEITLMNHSTGELEGTVIDVMKKTSYNLQEILYSSEYRLIDIIDEYNSSNLNDDNEETVEDFLNKHSLVSPKMKRSLVQAYSIIQELKKILKTDFDKYYVECTRTNLAKKEIKHSRYEKLKDLYKNCKSIAKELNVDFNKLNKELDNNQDKLKSDALFLYFTQLGRCMYSFEPIDLGILLSNNNMYDIDHIYPQSLIKDDSISNRVLVLKSYNERKGDNFLFELDNKFLNPNIMSFYKKLYDLGLIQKQKYNRLTKKEIKKEELEGFVNRQLVSTNQAVKGLIQVLKYKDNINPTDIVFSKSENISIARQLFDWPKSRLANNFHHAHDAYLNVVIGRTINNYFTYNSFYSISDYYRFKEKHLTMNISTLLKYDRKYKDKIIWNKEETIKLVNKNLYERFDVNETTRTYNSNVLYGKTTILPAGQGTVPLKQNGPLSDMSRYGAITSYSYSKYVIVENINKKGQKEYILEAIPKMYDNQNNVNEYLNSVGYKDYKIVCDNIKTKVVIEDEKRKYLVSGKSDKQYLIVNLYDRYFSKYYINVIKKLEKYNKNSINKIKMYYDEEKIEVSGARAENSPILLYKREMVDLYNEIKKKFTLDKYSFNAIKNIYEYMNVELNKFTVIDMVAINTELLKLLLTNTMQTCDLTLINMSKNSGKLRISNKLRSKMKLISESVTGYYRKVLFEVPE